MIDLAALTSPPRRRPPRLRGRRRRRARLHPQRGLPAGQAARAPGRRAAARAGGSRGDAHRSRAAPGRRRRPAAHRPRGARVRPAPRRRPRGRSPAGGGVLDGDARPGRTRRCAPSSTRIPTSRSRWPSASPGTPSTWSPPVRWTSGSCTAGATCRSRPRAPGGLVVARDVADVIVPAGHRLAGRTRVSPARPRRRGLDRHPRGHDLPAVAAPDVRRHRPAAADRPRRRWSSTPTSRSSRAGLGIALVPRLGRAPLGEDVVAVAAHRPRPRAS